MERDDSVQRKKQNPPFSITEPGKGGLFLQKTSADYFFLSAFFIVDQTMTSDPAGTNP